MLPSQTETTTSKGLSEVDSSWESPLPYAMLVSRNFPPLQGGMERLNQHLLIELSRIYQTALIGPRGAETFAPTAKDVRTCPSKPIHAFLASSCIKAVSAACRLRPALILAGSGANALPAFLAAKCSGAKWGIYLHGLDIVVDNALYRQVMLPIIRKADFWLVNSRATMAAGSGAGLDPNRMHLLNPGVSIPERLPSTEEVSAWRKSIDAGSRPILLSVGRLTRRKGLREFILKSLPGILKEEPEALLVVVGSEPNDALAVDAVGFEALRRAAVSIGAGSNLCILGSISDTQLALAYRAATVHVFPVLELQGDMEGFGMVAIEAAAYGVPTVAFDVGGVSDAVFPRQSGVLLASGDYAEFSEQVLDLLRNVDQDLLARNCRSVAANFSWSRFGERLRDFLSP